LQHDRLARAQSPWPTPQLAAGTNQVRSERIFYDGVRRIQELTTDPINDTESAAASGNEEALETLNEQPSANQSSASAGTEMSQLRDPGLPAGMTLAREYVWGPGDYGIDELLCQYGPDRTPSYPMHDAGGDIVALADKNGLGGTPRLLWQGTYDAYGQIIEQQTHFAHPYLHAGHKGLFFDRLDAGIVDPNTLAETPRLMPAGHAGTTGTARLIGYARNRTLHTGFGRWLQRDPNGSGAFVLAFGAMHGMASDSNASRFSISEHHRDGANVLAYASSPWTSGDPMGLFIQSPFDTMMMGQEIMSMLSDVFAEYAEAYEDMMDWALDWSARDDEYDGTGMIDLTGEMEIHGPWMGGIASGLAQIFKKGAKKLSMVDRSAFRKQARQMFKEAMKAAGRKLGKGFDIHHRIPLRFAHIMGVDPNLSRNLQKVARGTHNVITELWEQFARKHRNPPPTKVQLEAFARKIDKDFKHALESLDDVLQQAY
jgi:hypothetical protein